MRKHLLFALLLAFSFGCGKKSVIKNAVEAQTTAEAYGDGEHTVLPLVLPLSDQVIPNFDSTLGKIGFVAGGFAKMFMNLGASLGMGKMQLSLIQQIPELPDEYFKSTAIKRVFFYIEPTEGTSRWKNWYQRWILGRSNVEFKFIDKIAVKLSPHHVENTDSWMPIFDVKSVGKREFSPFERLFEDREKLEKVDPERAKELVLLLYEKGDEKMKNDIRYVFIIDTDTPVQTRRFLENYPELRDRFKRINVLNKSLLVEIENDRVLEETFKTILSENKEELEDLGVTYIDQCTSSTCLDLNVPNLNIVPMLLKDNAIKLDAFIDAREMPDSFQLKGLIEFELKLKLTF